MKKKIQTITRVLSILLVLSFCIPSVTAKSKGMGINKAEVTLHIGEEVALKVTNAEKSVHWESANPEIATVSADGTVTAKGVGVAIILATAGDQACVCTVIVTEETKSALSLKTKEFQVYGDGDLRTDIDMHAQTLTVYENDKLCKKFTVTNSNNSVCKVTNQKDGTIRVHLLKGGKSDITIKTKDQEAVFHYSVAVRIHLNYGPGVTKFNYMPASEPVISLNEGDSFGSDVDLDEFLAVVTVSGASSKKYTVTSSNEKICKVTKKKDGTLIIEPKKKGECVIKIKAKNYTAKFNWKQ